MKNSSIFHTNAIGNNAANGSAIATAMENLDILEANLLYDKAIVTEQSTNTNLIVIPINDAIKEKKHVSSEASLNLALNTDKTGKLISGNIICFFPTDKKKRDNFSLHIIADFLKGNLIGENGTIKMLNLTGRWLRQFEFKDKKMVSCGTIQAKQNSDTKKVNSTCIDWYLVTTYHYSNGSTYQTSEYVGTTCDGCNTPDYQSLCPTGEGGGGGGNDVEYTRYAYLNFTVDPQIPGNDSIRVRGFLDVVGTGSGTSGIFLSANMSGSQVLWKDPSYTYTQTGSNAYYVNTPSPLVTGSFTGTIYVSSTETYSTGLTRQYTYPQAFTP